MSPERSPPRGAAPVGTVDELAEFEATAVIYMRLWCAGPQSQATVWTDFARHFGARRGADELKALERLLDLIAQSARRPVMRHQIGCPCLGGDEATFANLIAAAVGGEREDALMLACLMVRPDMAPAVVAQATRVGLALHRMSAGRARPGAAPASRSAEPTRH